MFVKVRIIGLTYIFAITKMHTEFEERLDLMLAIFAIKHTIFVNLFLMNSIF